MLTTRNGLSRPDNSDQGLPKAIYGWAHSVCDSQQCLDVRPFTSRQDSCTVQTVATGIESKYTTAPPAKFAVSHINANRYQMIEQSKRVGQQCRDGLLLAWLQELGLLVSATNFSRANELKVSITSDPLTCH